jgi:hypothetical protein
MKWISRIATPAALLIFALWIIGMLLTDRWTWSQWLAWIPTQIILVVLVSAILVAIISKRKRHASCLFFILAAALGWFVFVENHFFASSYPRDGLRLVGWTMSHNKESGAGKSADSIISYDGDITLLTHGWQVRGQKKIKEWVGIGSRRIVSGPFTLLTKLQVLEVRTLIASDGIYVSMFKVDATEQLGKPIVVWAIDLPSTMFLSRANTAKRAKRLLATLDVSQPDLVIGDFNMTRNSFAIQTMFPTLIDASDEGGIGLLASFPTEYPLYHIDHTLLSRAFSCKSYFLVNPNIGRHRVQITEIIAK